MAVRNRLGRDGGRDFGYTIDLYLAPTGAAAHDLASAGHRRILVQLSSPEAQQRQVEADMRRPIFRLVAGLR